MPKTVQAQINDLKKAHQDALLKKNTCETQLEMAMKNLAMIEQQCQARGLSPEQLPSRLTELQNLIQEKLKEANALMPATIL